MRVPGKDTAANYLAVSQACHAANRGHGLDGVGNLISITVLTARGKDPAVLGRPRISQTERRWLPVVLWSRNPSRRRRWMTSALFMYA